MRLAIIIAVGALGVLLTLVLLARMIAAVRRGAPRQLVLGYLALMVVITVVSFALMRVL